MQLLLLTIIVGAAAKISRRDNTCVSFNGQCICEPYVLPVQQCLILDKETKPNATVVNECVALFNVHADSSLPDKENGRCCNNNFSISNQTNCFCDFEALKVLDCLKPKPEVYVGLNQESVDRCLSEINVTVVDGKHCSSNSSSNSAEADDSSNYSEASVDPMDYNSTLTLAGFPVSHNQTENVEERHRLGINISVVHNTPDDTSSSRDNGGVKAFSSYVPKPVASRPHPINYLPNPYHDSSPTRGSEETSAPDEEEYNADTAQQASQPQETHKNDYSYGEMPPPTPINTNKTVDSASNATNTSKPLISDATPQNRVSASNAFFGLIVTLFI